MPRLIVLRIFAEEHQNPCFLGNPLKNAWHERHAIVSRSLLAIGFSTQVRAAIIHVELPPPHGMFGRIDGTEAQTHFDLDGNGTDDVCFLSGTSALGWYVGGVPTTRILTIVGQGNSRLESGQLIGENPDPSAAQIHTWITPNPWANLSFVFNDGNDISGGSWHNQEGFLGVEFQSDEGIHYGWIRAEGQLGFGGFVYEYAYETEPGRSIRAGVIPEPSALALCLMGALPLLRRRR